MLRVFGVLCVASGFVPVTPRARGALFAAPTLNPVEEMVRKGQIAAYEAAAMVISLKISSKIAEKEETLPPGMASHRTASSSPPNAHASLERAQGPLLPTGGKESQRCGKSDTRAIKRASPHTRSQNESLESFAVSLSL